MNVDIWRTIFLVTDVEFSYYKCRHLIFYFGLRMSTSSILIWFTDVNIQ